MKPQWDILLGEPTGRARTFFLLWPMVGIYQTIAFYRPEWLYILTLCAASFAFIRPSILALLVYASSQFLMVSGQIPYTPNHWILFAYIDLAIVLTIFSLTLFPGKDPSDSSQNLGERVMEVVGPVILLGLFLVYILAALHKANLGFVQSPESCAIDFVPKEIRNTALVALVAPFLGYAVLLFDATIPFLLLVPKTRLVGVAVGLCVHLIWSLTDFSRVGALAGVTEFSITIFACYVLLFKENPKLDAFRLLSHIKNRVKNFPFRKVLVGLALSNFVLAFFIDSWAKNLRTIQSFIWLPIILGIFLVLLFFAFKETPLLRHHRLRILRIPKVLIPLPLFVIVWGLTPYFGIKEVPAFSMFSNLQINEGRWNHLFLPESLKVFKFQDDLVAVLTTDLKTAGSVFSMEGRKMVYMDMLSRHIGAENARTVFRRGQSTEESVLVVRNGEMFIDDEPVPSVAWWGRYAFRYRSVHSSDVEKCRW